MTNRIDLDDAGTPDDVVFEDVAALHIERMAAGYIWAQVCLVDGRQFRIQFATPRNGRLLWMLEEDS